jgi:stearoyl-CoA desaturase (delta-9 desaturase)
MTTTESVLDPVESIADGPAEPGTKSWTQQITLSIFIVLPFLAAVSAVPLTWNRGLGYRDAIIAGVLYALSGLGITVGYHRYLTHRAFKTSRPIRIALAIAGCLALEATPIQWVADHRRHHRFSDKPGDPHSPWRYGTSPKALTKGFFYSHVGWLYDWETTDEKRYAPDLVGDPDMVFVSKYYVVWVAASLLVAPLAGGLWGWSWNSAFTAFIWGSLVRIFVLHHVTFAINSVCHITGRRPFKTRDRSQNVWWLALLSFGESWHNFHHAEPASARHGVRTFEIDLSAGLIKAMEKLRLVRDVRWPDRSLIERRRAVSA